jgi:SAM-dependent methyltransferase
VSGHSGEREALRQAFEAAAAHYHQARPDYPEALYDCLVSLTGLRDGARLLEVGGGTGKGTLPLARRGYRITVVELGAQLAERARANLAAFDGVDVVTGNFETWPPAGSGPFDLVFSATAWHWIDPAVKYQRAWELLRPGGHLAIWGTQHIFPADADPFFRGIQDVYDEIGEGLPPGDDSRHRPALEDIAGWRDEIAATGLFGDAEVRRFGWEAVYTAEEYIGLLNTFSGHISWPQWKRDRLYGEIRRRLAARPDGRLRRHWGVALHIAPRALPGLA